MNQGFLVESLARTLPDPMFDRSLLPEAKLEFVVVSDTHYMLDPGTGSVEFESRRLQTARAELALQLIASLDPAFVVHLGDLVQEFPESRNFERAMGQAKDQLARHGVPLRYVAGNHDVGDKPDPTMPTAWVTTQSLSRYHEDYGRSWYSWDVDGLHFVVVNSQVMNTALPEAEAQRKWLESDLRESRGSRIFMFMHLPPFIEHEEEAALGHYDNVDQPARRWLLSLVRKHEVELLFAGHTHFAFFDRIGETRYFVASSPAFSRPGFGEVFSGCPPPERGRNDVPKLGFYLVRVYDHRVTVHFIRTYGQTLADQNTTDRRYLITRTSGELSHSPLGIALRHPLSRTEDLPVAWPSAIRQRVRNDYPFLACTELGVRYLRIPASDLCDQAQCERVRCLSAEGVHVTASWLWSEGMDLPAAAAPHQELLKGVELLLPGATRPSQECLRQIERCSAELGISITVAPLIPRERVPGKQHSRTRVGYRPNEVRDLDGYLLEHKQRLNRILCRVGTEESPWEDMQRTPGPDSLDQVSAVDWVVDFSTEEGYDIRRAAEALFGAAARPSGRLYLEPLVDLDRTMDTSQGLIDRLCNPRPVFNVVRCLNTILFGSAKTLQRVSESVLPDARILGLKGPHSTYWLVLPKQKRIRVDFSWLGPLGSTAGRATCYRLETGTSCHLDIVESQKSFEGLELDESALVVLPAAGSRPHIDAQAFLGRRPRDLTNSRVS